MSAKMRVDLFGRECEQVVLEAILFKYLIKIVLLMEINSYLR